MKKMIEIPAQNAEKFLIYIYRDMVFIKLSVGWKNIKFKQ